MNKNLRKISPVITLIAGIAAGLLLLIKPSAALNSVIKILGWGMIIAGAIQAVSLFLSGSKNANDYYNPLAFAVGGIAVLTLAHLVKKLIPLAIGIMLLVMGVLKIKNAFAMKNGNDKKWIITLVMAAFSVVFALFIIFHPATFTNTVLRIIGVLILLECADDIFALKIFR